jgi:fluoride exporter
MLTYVYVAVGSAIGGLARFALGNAIQQHYESRPGAAPFPLGILLVNVSGSFLIGALLVAVARQGSHGDALRMLLVVGLCGGYTTFSTFSADTMILFENGASGMALLNILASVLLALGATFAGAFLARAAFGRLA